MKRVFVFLMVLLLLVGMVPLQSFAASGPWDVRAYYGDYEYVTVSHTQAYSGETVAVTPLTGYRLTKLEVYMGEAEQVPATHNGTSGSFTMPDSPVEILVEVESTSGGGAPHRVTDVITADHADPVIANNSSKTIEAMAGTTITIDPRPDEGYEFVRIKLEYADGTGKWLDDGVLSFEMPDIDLYVAVYYKGCDTGNTDCEYPVSVYTDKNGQATPSKTSAKPGEEITVTCTPNTGYSLGTINSYANTASGMLDLSYQLTGNNQFTFNMPNAEAYIVVYFSEGNGGSNPPQTTLYNITVETDGNGTLISSELKAEEGDYITVAATPNTGYELDKIIVTDGTNTSDITEDQAFYMPASDITVRATFKAIDNGGQVYNVIVNPADNGTVSATHTQAQAGTLITVTTAPDDGYELDTLTVKDGSNNAVTVTDGKFTMPQSDVTVTATFKVSGNGGEVDPTLYSVDVRNAANGSVSANPQWAAEGTIITLTANPDTGYELDTLKCRKINTDNYIDVNVDGNQGQFTMPASDVMVIATFKRAENTDGDETTHAIHLSYDKNQVAVTASATEAKAGENVTITTTPKKFSGGQWAVKSIWLIKNDDYSVREQIPLLTKSFTMPDYDVIVNVICEVAQTRKITMQVVKGVAKKTSISAPGNLIQLENGVFGAMESLEITIGATPADGYELEYINVYKADTGELYVSTKDGKFSMPNFDVRVDIAFQPIGGEAPTMYKVTVNDSEHGTVTATPTQAEAGTTITVSAIPEEGYVLESITITGAQVTVNDDGTFTMPAADVTVTAAFTKIESDEPEDYSITVTDPENGTASAPAKGKPGDTVTVTATPAAGYELDEITAVDSSNNSVTVTDGKFTMPESDVTVTVTFKTAAAEEDTARKYNVILNPTVNGTASVNKTKAKQGDTVTVTATAAAGYILTGISVTNDTTGKTVTMQAGGKTFLMPDSDVTVTVAFEKDKTVTVEHTTDPDHNAYKADLDMPDKDVLKKLLGDEAATEDTKVWMTVAKLADAPSAEKQAIEAVVGSDKLAVYLDIKLFKKVGNRDAEAISNTRGPVTITMTLDAGVVPADAESVYIVYYHGGAKTIPASYNHSTRVLTFQASEFSTYALAYKLQAPAATTSAGVLDNVPKTGNSNPLTGWAMLVLCSAAMLAGVALFDKKRAR